MNSLVIVAIPSDDDYVHKLSSQKVAHMTILFLGEDITKVRNVTDILNFTKHASDQTLSRFGLEVDRRGVLGPDSADVLFLAKSKWSGFDTINSFRSNLLKNDNIRTAYDSADQFSEWTPHVTLGYPDTPANPDDRDYPGCSYVNFDRIAVWFSDNEGIEFPLKKYDFDDFAMDIAMSNIKTKKVKVIENILTHAIPYDPVKAHEYYIKNRQLKGRGTASSVISRPRISSSSTFNVKLASGRTVRLSQQQLVEQKAYAAKRVGDITKRLSELGTELKKKMVEAKKNPTAAEKSKAARESKQYREVHKQKLATKSKTERSKSSSTKKSKEKDSVAELQHKIKQVKGSLKAAIERQRILSTAVKD